MKSLQLGHSAASRKALGRALCWMLVWTAVMMTTLPALAAPADKQAPRVASKAGNITALLPTAHIVRGSGRNAVSSDAKRGDEVLWNDLVKTDKGGRARLTLTDQSILSLGSQAELRVVKHDARTQQTSLELAYGRLRAEVSTVTRDGGNFQLKTPTAVAGVIGTVFGSDTSIGQTTFLCISGVVSVGSSDPSLPGTTTCEPGMAVTVAQGKAPAKRTATTQEIQQFIQDTEPAAIQAISPASALAGTSLDALITGTHLDGVSSIDAGNGVSVSLKGNNTSTNVNTHVTVQPSAQPGPRVLTLHKQNGQSAAVVFAVLAPPGSPSGSVDLASLKKPFYDVFDQERQSELAALNGLGLTVKQSADGAADQLTQANQGSTQPISLVQAGNDLQAPVTDINTYVVGAAQKLLDAQTQAQKDLDAKLTTAIANLQGRTGGLTPDDAFKTEVQTGFTAVNNAMLQAFLAAHTQSGTQAQTDNTTVNSAFTYWMNQITQNSPRWDNKEQTTELGAVATFDAGKIANNASTIQWMLCDPTYKPTKLGGNVPVSQSACQPIPGFSSSTTEFAVATCTLNPADYVVRVVLNNQNGFETLLHVTRPGYDDPATRLQNLAASYSTLKSDNFMSFFDASLYPAYTTLSENIRNTMQELSSMNVLVRANGAPAVVCNDATMSATWQSNYTFKGSTALTQQPAENITVRMHRTVGQGWFITDFQGDNGTVQGAPPGPQSQDIALPDPTVLDIGIFNGTQYVTGSNLSIAGGQTVFGATIKNIGNADLTQSVSADWTISYNGSVQGTYSSLINVAIPIGQTAQIQFPYSVPTLPAGAPVTVSLTINTLNPISEKSTANDTNNNIFSAGTVDLKVVSVTPASIYNGLPTALGSVVIQNLGTGDSPAAATGLVFTSDMGVTITSSLPAIPPGGQVTLPIPAFTPATTLGAHTFTATATVPGDLVPSNNTLTVNVSVLQAYDLKATSLVLSSNLIGGQAGTATLTVANAGTLAYPGLAGGITLTLPGGATVSAAVPAINAGGTAIVAIPFTTPMLSGSSNFTATISSPIAGDTTTNKTATTAAIVTLPYNLAISNIALSALDGGQPGTATVTISNSGPLAYPGLAGGITLTSTTIPVIALSSAIPTIPSGGSATVTFNFVLPMTPGAVTFTSTLANGIAGNAATGAQTLNQGGTIVAPYDLAVNSVTLSSNLIGGQSGSAAVVIANNGPVNFAGQASALTFTSNTTPALTFTVALPSINAGSTATINFPFTVPMQSGLFNWTATIATVTGNAATGAQTLTSAAAITLPYNLTVNSVTLSNNLIGGQSGSAAVVIANTGPLNFAGQANALTFTSNTTPALSFTVALPTINAGSSATVNFPFTAPMQSGSFNFTATMATVVGNAASGAQTLTSAASITLPYNLAVTNVSLSSNLIGGQSGTATITIGNSGPLNFPGLANTLTLSSPAGGSFSVNAALPAVTAGGSAIVTIPFTVPMQGGTFNWAATIAPGITGNAGTGAQTLSTSAAIALPYDLSVQSVVLSALDGGQSATATITLKNLGPLGYPGLTNGITLTSNTSPALALALNIPGIPSGSTATVTFTFTVPMTPGGFNFTATLAGGISGNAATGAQTLTQAGTIVLPYDLSVGPIVLSSLDGGQTGTATVTINNAGPVAFLGLPSGISLASNTTPAVALSSAIPPVPAGGSATVVFSFPVPMTPGSFNFTATLASGISGNAATGAQTLTQAGTIVLPYNLAVSNVTLSSNLIGGQAGSATVTIANSGPVNFPGATNQVTFTSNTTPALNLTANLPAVPAGGSATVNIPFTVPVQGGSFTWTATILPQTGNAATGAQTLGSLASITLPYNLAVNSVTLSSNLIGGQAGTATIVIGNTGPVNFAGQTNAVTFTSNTTPAFNFVVNLPAVNAGSTASINVPFTTPMQGGTFNFTATLAAVVGNTGSGAQTLTQPAGISLPYNLSVNTLSLSALDGGQAGTATVVVGNTGPLSFPGQPSALVFTSTTTPPVSVTVALPTIASNGTVSIPVPFTVPLQSGSFNWTATLVGGITGNAGTGPQTQTAIASITLPYNLAVNSVTLSSNLIGGQSGSASVVIGNTGPVNFAGQTNALTFTSNTTPALSFTVALPSINAGSTATVNFPFTVPMQGGTFNFTATILAVSGNTASGAQTLAQAGLITLPYALGVNTLSVPGTVVAGQPGSGSVIVTNNGPLAFPGLVGGLTITSSTIPTFILTENIPAIPAGSQASVPFTFTTPSNVGGQPITATIQGGIVGDTSSGKTTNSTMTILAATVDFSVTSVVNGASDIPPFLSGQTHSVLISVTNSGTVASAPSDTYSCTMSNGIVTTPIATGSVPSLASGASTILTVSYTVPKNQPSANTITCTLSTDPLETVTSNNAGSVVDAVNSNVNLLYATTPSIPSTLQEGSTLNVSVTVTNNGLDDAAAGWNVAAIFNSTVVATVTGPALASGAQTTQNLSFAIPSTGPAPQNVATTGSLVINQNAAIVETNTGDDTFSQAVTLVDFAATDSVPTMQGVDARTFSVSGFINANPSTYPFSYSYGATGLPTGLTINSTTGQLSGTPSGTFGPTAVNFTLAAGGVTHSAGSTTIQILPAISISPVLPLPTVTPGQTFTITLNVTGGAGTVTLIPTLPTGITPVTTLPTSPTAGQITWQLQAANNAASGSLNIPVQVTDAGVSATNTPAANFTYNGLTTSVSSQADFVITNLEFTNHPVPPYTGSNAIYRGEAADLLVTVANQGNSSVAGPLVFTATCSSPCSGSATGSLPTPPAPGASTTVTILLGGNNQPAGSYTANVVMTPIAGAVFTNGSFAFDVIDFSATETAPFTIQNMMVGANSTIPFNFAVTGTSPLPSVPLSASSTTGNTFSGLGSFANGSAGLLSVGVAPSTTPGTNDTVLVKGSGPYNSFSKTVISQAVRYYDISVAPVSGTNSSSLPFAVPVLTSVPGTPSKVSLKLTGTWDNSANLGADVTVGTQPAGVHASLVGGSGLSPTGTFELDVYALPGSTGVQPLTLNIAIPQTSPAQTYTYTFYLDLQPTVDLGVTAVTLQSPASFSSSDPWLYGEQAIFRVDYQNSGTGPSLGTEKLQLMFNGRPITSTIQTIGTLAAGGTAFVNIPVSLPDYTWGSTVSVNAQISPTSYDPNPGDNTLSSPPSYAVSDWRVSINGAGASDSNPLVLSSTSATASAGAYVLSASSAWSQAIALMGGATNTGFAVTLSGITSITTNSQSSLVMISAPSPGSLSPGFYYVQVIGTIGNVQRQGTIHISVSNANTANNITLTGTSPAVAGGSANILALSPATPTYMVQLNGPLPEQATLLTACSACTGTPTVDMSFSDTSSMLVVDPLTATSATPTEMTSKSSVSGSGGSVNLGLIGVLNPDGTINATANPVSISLTNPTPAALGKTRPYATGPDPVGSNVYTMLVNVGDIVVSPSLSCVSVPPGTSNVNLGIQVVAVNNFNANLTAAWFDSSGAPLSSSVVSLVGGPGVITYSGGYAVATYTFSNTNSSNGGAQVLMLGLTFGSASYAGQTATKYFPIAFDLGGGTCPTIPSTRALGATRAYSTATGGTTIRGFYGKHNATLLSGTRKLTNDGALPDVQLSSADIKYSPSVPKSGDVVEVRFKLKNAGAAVKSLPVALQMNGVTVARDTFDVSAAGSALGALHWDTAKNPATPAQSAAPQVARAGYRRGPAEGGGASTAARPQLAVVIDPDHTVKEASAINKSAAVTHFMMQGGGAPATNAGGGAMQRVILELGDGTCAGFKFASGPMMNCGGDVTITITDLGGGRYVLDSAGGVADLGASKDVANAKYGSQALAVAGHTYAVSLGNGQVGIITINSIGNRSQLAVQSAKLFRKVGPAKVIKSMGGGTGISEPGDMTGGMSKNLPSVFIDLGYQVQ